MTAGRGIVRSERPPAHQLGQRATLHGLEAWVALPAEAEEGAPAFEHAARATLPASVERGAHVRVLLGDWRGVRSPVRVASPTLSAMVELEAGAQLSLPTA